MSFEPLRAIRSRILALPEANIDTDQIVPARFLTTTTREGLGAHAFADWRYEGENGAPRPDHALNQPDAASRRVLVAGDNFGCGSSREHAPWALYDFGFRAIVTTSAADIFKANALKNGLLVAEIGEDAQRQLLAAPDFETEIDLEAQTVTLPDGSKARFEVDAFAKRCLMDGVDQLGFLLGMDETVEAYEKARG